MELSKDTLIYDGKKYPVVYLEFSEEERKRHDIQYGYLRFGSNEIATAMPEIDSDNWGDEEEIAYSQIDFTPEGNIVDDYAKGKITDGTMKMFLGRIVIEVFLH